jgi:3'-phosphoadenosine 5'-phosphosulfate sulfotransferase
MPEYSIEYADVYFVYGEYSRKANAMLLSAGMLMLVLRQGEDILNIYYEFNERTKLTNLISWWSVLDFKSL